MVVSKRCKVCTALDADNIAISGEYFNKSLPELIERISGIQLDPRKANGVLICKLCAIQLMHADLIIDKLRNTLHRLTKLVKVTKPKTPFKEIVANTISDEFKLKTKNSVVRRQSVFLDNSFVTSREEPKQIEANGNFTTPSTLVLNKDSIESNKQDEPTAITLEVVDRKSESQNYEEDNKQNDEIESNVTTTELKKGEGSEATSGNTKEVEQNAKTPKKIVRRKSIIFKESVTDNKDDFQQNSEEPKIDSTSKFKKFADGKLTPEKSKQAKPTKRKQKFKEVECGSNNITKPDICEISQPTKRYRSLSISASEGNPVGVDKDECDFAESYNENSLAEVKIKMLNCVICGKGFSQKASLREHIESNHMGEKLKECPNCSTEFRSQQKYESHVFSEKCKNSKHACQYPKCNRRFKTVYKMELHMQEKHSSQQESEVE